MKKINVPTFVFALLIPLLIGVLSAMLSSKGMTGYSTMNKPPLSPPAWIFPVAWTILYLLMGCASYYVIASDSPDKNTALILYAVQLAMNFCWSIIFFNMSMYLLAFFWLILMLAIVIIGTVFFFKISNLAGFLMIPYILWLMFAAYLNMGAYVLS